MANDEFDPDVLKRRLPDDIHAVVDQVKANVDLSVAQIIDEFKQNANKVVTDFQNQNFTVDLKAAIQKHDDAFQADLKEINGQITSMQAAAARAATLANSIDNVALKNSIADLVQQSTDLQNKLTDFKNKTSDFAQKAGGAIATAALKAFTGGIG